MVKYEMDKSSTLSAHEFFKKFNVEDQCYDIFEEVDVVEDDNLARKKKTAVTDIPPDVAIKEPPSTHEELTKFLQEHLQISNLTHISVDDQQQLADVLTMAIIAIWPEHRKQAPDPFLSDIGNKELQRRIAVHIVETAEELFYEYVSKAEEVNRKAVFSAEANLTRLKTQLFHEASCCLNALKVRRRLASNMRGISDEEWFLQRKSNDGMLYPDFGPLDSKTKARLEKNHHQFTKKQLDEVHEHLKSFETTLPETCTGLKEMLDGHNDNRNIKMDEHKLNVSGNTHRSNSDDREDMMDTTVESNAFLHQRSSSMPNLEADTESIEEFGELSVIRSKRTQSFDHLIDDTSDGKIEVNESDQFQKDVSCEVKQDILDDMETEDFSPLLQVLGTQPKRKKIVQAVVVREDSDDDLFSGMNLADEVEDGDRLASYRHLPQPSVVNVKVPGKGIVRISDVSVSTRINESALTLHKYPTMYNEFLGEIDDATVKSLDEHLFAGKQAQEVYDEITKTMNKDFLRFDKDDFVEDCAQPDENTSSLFMSALLQEKQKSHFISEELKGETHPPWDTFPSNDAWRNYPRFGGLGREEILEMSAKPKEENETYNMNKNLALPNRHIMPSVSHIQKSYSAWLSWYKTHLDTDDYKKFLCNKENDYLCQLFHLYDSEDSEDEEEENLQIKAMEMQILEQQRRRKEEIREEKQRFERGFWNTKCVVLGGLGKDPEFKDSEELEIADAAEKIEESEKVSTYICLQERLERIWKLLKTPEQGRIDMAMKYSDFGGTEKLTEAIGYWESVTDLIVERESLMGKLEDFERSASDPNRFFRKGPDGSSIARINEAKTRDKLMKGITLLEEEIKPMLIFMEKQFGDRVTYQNRIYSQKLQTDRVEMLYWLQQERRQQAIDAYNSPITSPTTTPIKCKDVPSISA